MKEISNEDKAYFAGLFDGEGCVVINRADHNLMVTFGLTYAPVLYKMLNLFGGSVHKRNMQNMKNSPHTNKLIESGVCNISNWKQVYVYTVRGKDAWLFLKSIEQYSIEKKEQISIAIEFFNGRTHKYKSKSQIERGEFFYEKLRSMKKNSSDDIDIMLVDNQTKLL